MLRNHREDAENVTADILKEAGNIVKHLTVDITTTYGSGGQKHKNQKSIIILKKASNNSLIGFHHISLEVRFTAGILPSFSLTHLHPSNLRYISLEDWKESTSSYETFYNLQTSLEKMNCCSECGIKYRKHQTSLRFLKKGEMFYPTIRKVIQKFLSQAYTSTIERSFSSL